MIPPRNFSHGTISGSAGQAQDIDDLDCRHEQAATAISSNIELGEWGKYLGDATLAAAVLDRLAMTSIHIDIDGPSYRDHLAEQRAKDRGIVDDAGQSLGSTRASDHTASVAHAA